MKPTDFHPEAQDEFDQAADYYDSCVPGLGDEFRDEVGVALRMIASQPRAGARYPGTSCRWRLTARFPYKVVYFELADRILVFSVHHTSRDPGYWLHRLGSP